MHITFCNSETGHLCDAQSIFQHRLITGLEKLGHETKMLLITPRFSINSPSLKFCREHSIQYSYTYSLGSTTNNIRWCLNQLKSDLPDILIIQNYYWACYATMWIKGIPCITVFDNEDVPTYELIKLFANKKSIFCSNAAVCVSEGILKNLKEVYSDIPSTVIPYGVQIPELKKSLQIAPFKISYFGRIEQEQKRIIDTTSAFCNAARNIDGVEAHIWGSGNEDKNVKKILNTDGRGLNVFFHGPIANKLIYNKMQEYHVIVLLSDYEGTPTVLMEAMANGLVPIVTEIAGGTSSDLVINGVTGIVVKNRKEDFLHALRKIKGNKDLLRMLSVNARKHIINNYSLELTTKKWGDFMGNLIRNSDKMHKEIIVPRCIKIPNEYRIENVRYLSPTFDVFAMLYTKIRSSLLKCIKNFTLKWVQFFEQFK